MFVDANGQIMRSTNITGSPGWLLTGNTGTVDGTNFVGTTDNVPFNIRVNNQKAGRVASDGIVFLGYQAGNINIGANNTGSGYQALYSNTTGNNNTANGYQAGEGIVSGSNNTCIGFNADLSANHFNNATAVGNGAIATTSNQVGLGNSDVSSLYCQGAYTTTSSNSPNMYVDANGQIVRSNGNAGSPNSLLTGNAGTVDGTHFVGTTDNVPFNIRVNNQKAGRVTSEGNVFLGYQAGNSNLIVSSNTGIGYQSLYSNTSGGNNTANGYMALYNDT